jgi:hypothetical protein
LGNRLDGLSASWEARIVAFGQDWITAGKMSVSFAGLGIWGLYCGGESGNELNSVSLLTAIQAPDLARPAPDGEKSTTPDGKNAFKSLGKYWFIDAIIDHGGATGKRHYIGLFDVWKEQYIDLQNKPNLIAQINANGKALFRF